MRAEGSPVSSDLTFLTGQPALLAGEAVVRLPRAVITPRG